MLPFAVGGAEILKSRVAILGGGITGLAAARWLEHDHGITDVVVIEAADSVGGKVRSEIDTGHVLEWGPQGFLNNAPSTLELVEIENLGSDLQLADEASADRFILRGNVLRSVPTSPLAFMRSSLLPLSGRLRVLAEPFARKRPGSDETVFDFAKRRIGPQAAATLVDAMVTGVFAGDSRKLSLAATFPRMAAMEAEHGSLTRALIAKMREARRAGRRSSGPAGPGGTLCTFRRGMDQLPRRLAETLGDRVLTGRPIHALEWSSNRTVVHTDDDCIEAENVLLTTPASVTSDLITDLAPAAAQALNAIQTVPIAVLMASYDDTMAFGQPLGGFGFLVPSAEELGILGTLFCHSTFPGQAPDGRVFLRTMVGGAREPQAAELDDEALTRRVRAALSRVFGRDPDPTRQWIIRHSSGISQYTVGHLDRVVAIENALRPLRMDVAGSPYRGVSVNDCIKQARAAARRIAGQ